MVPNGPVIILAFDGNCQRPSLRMALDTGIACRDIIHSRRIQNVSAGGMFHVLTSRPVALFAADVPLRHLLGVDVVIDRVASIASRTRGPLHIVRRIKRLPPVSPFGHKIRPPDAMGHIPLRGFWKIIVTSLGEVTLLPEAAVN